MKIKLALGIVASTLSLAGAAPGQESHREAAAPRLTLAETEFDFGEVKAGAEAKHSLRRQERRDRRPDHPQCDAGLRVHGDRLHPRHPARAGGSGDPPLQDGRLQRRAHQDGERLHQRPAAPELQPRARARRHRRSAARAPCRAVRRRPDRPLDRPRRARHEPQRRDHGLPRRVGRAGWAPARSGDQTDRRRRGL